jgi:endonuclease YncB( thermonuclease family)
VAAIKAKAAASLIILLLACSAFARERTYGNFTVRHVDWIIDGDTFVVDLSDAYPPLFADSIHVRIDSIDTPEIHSKDSTERAVAQAAKAFIEQRLLAARRVKLVATKRDKYFRVLASVYCDTLNLGKDLLRRGMARPYLGGTK